MKASSLAVFCSWLLFLSAPLTGAYTYTIAPGYNSGGTIEEGAGGMVMLNLTFDGTNLTMAPQTGIIYLARRPIGSFDPAAPWGVLDGTAYSRRLGWDDAKRPRTLVSEIQALTGGTVWIEKTGGSPELKNYYAQNSLPGSSTNPITRTYTYYGPILGTDGSSPKWMWDGLMDHNAYAVDLASVAPHGTQTFHTDYRIYIGDALGNELLDAEQQPLYGATTTTWTWTLFGTAPEPASLVILVGGAGILAGARRGRSRKA